MKLDSFKLKGQFEKPFIMRGSLGKSRNAPNHRQLCTKLTAKPPSFAKSAKVNEAVKLN